MSVWTCWVSCPGQWCHIENNIELNSFDRTARPFLGAPAILHICFFVHNGVNEWWKAGSSIVARVRKRAINGTSLQICTNTWETEYRWLYFPGYQVWEKANHFSKMSTLAQYMPWVLSMQINGGLCGLGWKNIVNLSSSSPLLYGE